VKPPVKTLAEIASEAGWTLKTIGVQGAPDYQFTKGKLRIKFSRRGHGSLLVTWGDLNASWSPVFKTADDKEHRLYLDTREEYAAALLATITEEAVHARIEDLLKERIEHARRELAKAEANFESFKAMGDPTPNPA